MPKFENCRYCGSSNISSGACKSEDGYIGYTRCIDCGFSVQTTNQYGLGSVGLEDTRGRAVSEARRIWNTINAFAEIGEDMRGHISRRSSKMKFEKE